MMITTAVINLSVAVIAACFLAIIWNQRIKKNLFTWIVLISGLITSTAMVVNQQFYSVAFAGFATVVATFGVYNTYLIFKRGSIS